MDPTLWINTYSQAMEVIGASETLAVKHMPMMLGETTRKWLERLPRDSVNSWADFYPELQRYVHTTRQ
jgi:hypothetical protein